MMKDKQQLIEKLFEKGILINKEMLEQEVDSSLIQKIENEPDIMVLNSDYVTIIHQQTSLIDWYEIDKHRVDAEKDRNDDLYQRELQEQKKLISVLNPLLLSSSSKISDLESELQTLSLSEITSEILPLFDSSVSSSSEITSPPSPNYDTLLSPQVNLEINSELNSTIIVTSYETIAHKYDITDFTNFFISRFKFLESILRNRQEMDNILTINRAFSKKEKEKVSLIGIIAEISTTKNGNLILILEDLTGRINVLISKNKKELFNLGKDLVVDEVIGISGTSGDKIIFAENVIWPDIPLTHEMKKSEVEEYAIFLSDIHFGSALFLHKEFERFLRWIRGESGNDTQRKMASLVKYVFVVGDLVDGVGIYPSQEEELEVKDITAQYEGFAKLISQIPSDKQLIMCPGNHDVVHLAEPQPVFYKEFASALYDLPNAILVTNPAIVNIGKTKDFSGFDVLMYHGYSFDYFVANVESIRNGGGYHRADLIMKYLLKRRHLAPSFASTPYLPSFIEDPLLIKKIPDFFVTGHIHYSKVANYRGITMMSGSCWQGKTSFQEKLGHQPEAARVPLVNLKTREVKVLKFIEPDQSEEKATLNKINQNKRKTNGD